MNISPSSSQSENYATVSTSPAKRRAGRTKFQETRHAVYRGVRRRGPRRWVCEVREPNKKSRIWLGTFPTPEMAARAHDVAVMALRGPSACLNFANSALLVTNIPPPSAGARGIKLAAAEAARAFCMPEHVPSKSVFTEDVDQWMESGMQGEYCYYASMAEGMLLDPPPPMPDSNWDDVDADAHVSLWT